MTIKHNPMEASKKFSYFRGVTHCFEEPLPSKKGPAVSVRDGVRMFEVYFGGWMEEMEPDNRP